MFKASACFQWSVSNHMTKNLSINEKVVGKLKKYTVLLWVFFTFALLLLSSCSNDDDVTLFTGIVESPKQIIYSQVEGQINEILKVEGEEVGDGDVVAQVEDEFYTYETDEANAAVKAIESEIDRLESDDIDEGDIKKYRFELEQAEAKLNQAKYRQSKTKVTIPAEGIITEWYVRQGDFVQIGTPLHSLTLKQPMELTIYVPQRQMSAFNVGERVSITAVSLPDERFTGEIVRIAEEAVYSPKNMETAKDKAKKVFPIEIVIEDYGNLKAGMDVDVEID